MKNFFYFLLYITPLLIFPGGIIFADSTVVNQVSGIQIVQGPVEGPQLPATPSGVTQTFNQYFLAMMGLVGVSAFFMITWGGIQYASSGGNPSAVGAAKNKIWGAVLGLILAAFSVLILKTINPDLVTFKISTPSSTPCQGPNGITVDCNTGLPAGQGQ